MRIFSDLPTNSPWLIDAVTAALRGFNWLAKATGRRFARAPVTASFFFQFGPLNLLGLATHFNAKASCVAAS
jgi:hypothetical protein